MNTSDLIERFYREIWNAHDLAAATDICSQQLVFRGSLGDESTGLSSFLTYVESIHTSLDEYHCHIEELVTEPARGFAKMNFTGRHTEDFLGFSPTNKTLSWSGAALFHIADSKISSVWVLGDLHGLRLQLSGEE